MSRDGTRPLAGQMGNPDDPYGINTPKAGRELDALIAEKVMGWTKWRSPVVPRGVDEPDCWRTGDPESPTRKIAYWSPSADIAAAWLIVEKMQQHGGVWLVEITSLDHGPTEGNLAYRVEFRECSSPWRTAIEEAATAPLAICRAAIASLAAPGRADD